MNYAKYIDHTLLKQESTRAQVDKILDEATEYHFKSVCINTTHVKYAADKLQDTDELICTVICFTLCATNTAMKNFEVEDSIKNGASEVDMVINIGSLKDRRYD